MDLRPYQRDAINSVWDYFNEGNEGNPLVVAPTGCGKSHIIAQLSKEAIEQWRDTRIIILSHRKEILEQNAQKIFSIWPSAPLGIYSAGLGSKRIGRITLAGIQSIAKKAENLPPVDLCIIDECHLVPKKGLGLYRTFLAALKAKSPSMRAIGFTATPYRIDSGLLTDGDESLFTDIVCNISLVELIKQGFLSSLVSKNSVTQADLSNVRTSGGEYILREAAQAIDKAEITEAALDEVARLGAERRSWLFFCTTVEHVAHVVEALKRRGINAEGITGDTTPMIRASLINKFRAGGLRALVSCEVLTTGFDAPNVDLIALLRSTKSTSLYIQMLGRGMRIAPNKANCLVLDFAGNLETHGPIDCIEIHSKAGSKTGVSVAPSKTCPECRSLWHAAVTECAECGYVFPTSASPIHAPEATAGEFISALAKPVPLQVESTTYKSHRSKSSGYAVLRVIYSLGITDVSEFVCLEHDGFAKERAKRWWKEHGGQIPAPDSVTDAVVRIGELRKVEQVFLKKEKGFDRVVSVNLSNEREQSEVLESEELPF